MELAGFTINIPAKSDSGWFGRGLNVIDNYQMFRLNGFNFGHNYFMNDYNSLKFKVSGFNYEHYNSTDKYGPDLYAKVSALEAKGSIKGGNSIISQSLSGEGCIDCADANYKTKLYAGSEGKVGFETKVGAGIYGARGKVTGGTSLLGTTVTYKVGASTYTANATFHGHLYWDKNKGTAEFSPRMDNILHLI